MWHFFCILNPKCGQFTRYTNKQWSILVVFTPQQEANQQCSAPLKPNNHICRRASASSSPGLLSWDVYTTQRLQVLTFDELCRAHWRVIGHCLEISLNPFKLNPTCSPIHNEWWINVMQLKNCLVTLNP